MNFIIFLIFYELTLFMKKKNVNLIFLEILNFFRMKRFLKEKIILFYHHLNQ